MLSQDMHDALQHSSGCCLPSSNYLSLLAQFLLKLKGLAETAAAYTEVEFTQMLGYSQLQGIIASKRMLSVQIKLVGYVLDVYDATHKADRLLEREFTDQADQLLALLQTKAIKLRKQFTTVALAMGENEYTAFIASIPLPPADWDWQLIIQR